MEQGQVYKIAWIIYKHKKATVMVVKKTQSQLKGLISVSRKRNYYNRQWEFQSKLSGALQEC